MLKHVYKPTALKEARVSKGLTTAKAARLAGLKPSRLSYVEKQPAEVKPRELVALASLYSLTAGHLSEWFGEEVHTSPPEASKRHAAENNRARSTNHKHCRAMFELIKCKEV
jgi:transcriptional regulator with XRE-family HTH domain